MTTDAVGGVWTYAANLATSLASRGLRVVLACMGPPPSSAQRAEVEPIQGVELMVGDYRLEWMDEPWQDVCRAGEWLLRLEAKVGADVVHLNGFVHAAWPFTAPTFVVAHSCVASWWRAVHGSDPPSSWSRYRSAVRSGLLAARRVVVPTEAMGRALLSAHGLVGLLDCEVVPNGLPLGLATAQGVEEPREELVFAAGRLWDEAKNMGVLDPMAVDLPWPVCVAGEARSPNGRTFAARGLRLLGQLSRDEVHARMARASIFCVPSLYEPFGLAALEAAQRGCALVLSELPSHREVWGDAALYVPARQASAWSEACRSLIVDPGRRRGLAVAARRRARAFDLERTTDAYLRIYGELGRPRSAAHAGDPAAIPIGRTAP